MITFSLAASSATKRFHSPIIECWDCQRKNLLEKIYSALLRALPKMAWNIYRIIILTTVEKLSLSLWMVFISATASDMFRLKAESDAPTRSRLKNCLTHFSTAMLWKLIISAWAAWKKGNDTFCTLSWRRIIDKAFPLRGTSKPYSLLKRELTE